MRLFHPSGTLPMRTLAVVCGVVHLAVCGRAADPSPAAPPPDLIVHNAKIAAVDGAFSIHEAMAVAGGRIVGVGSNDTVLGMRGPKTEVRDLQGRLVLPGLIDSHVHPERAAMHEWDHEIPDMKTIADVLGYIRSRADVLDDGDWIVVKQVFITRLAEQRYPTKAELDAAAPKNPVMFSTGPDASVNSLALAASGIDRDFRPTMPSARIERDPQTGEPTGILRSAAQYVKAQPKTRPSTQEERDARLEALCRDYNSVGITGIIDRGASPDSLAQFVRLRSAGRLTVRLAASYAVANTDGRDEILGKIAEIARHPLRAADEMIRLIGVKMWLDGGMLTGSAYMREPWGVSRIYSIEDPAYRGLRYVEPEQLAQFVAAATEQGLQFTAHVQGDGAVQSLLDAYETVNSRTPIRRLRHCLTHSSFMSRDSVQQAARLGVVMDIQPAWLWMDGRTLLTQFGDARLRYFQPLKSIFEAGAIAGGGSDHMQKIGARRSVNPYDPFLGMQTTITRIGLGMEAPLHPEESLSREQAIRFYTANNAFLMFLENATGSLEPGKQADFIVLDRDILTCPTGDIRDARVLETFLSGQSVYVAKP